MNAEAVVQARTETVTPTLTRYQPKPSPLTNKIITRYAEQLPPYLDAKTVTMIGVSDGLNVRACEDVLLEA